MGQISDTRTMTRNAQVPVKDFRFDLLQRVGGNVVTVELKKQPDGFDSYWWITGLNASQRLVTLLQMQVYVPGQNESDVITKCEQILAEHAMPIASLAASSNGQMMMQPLLSPEFRSKLLSAHMTLHEQGGSLGAEDEGIVLRVARQHQLATSLGATSVHEFIAAYDSIPVSTVKKRLERARVAGLIGVSRSSSTSVQEN